MHTQIRRALLTALLLFIPLYSYAESITPILSVYKNPQCGCCGKWITHLEDSGFQVDTYNMEAEKLNSLKNEFAITPQNQSCHTGIFDNKYFFEGHVPAKLVGQFLQNPPEGAIGLTVPGMPVGSPGMEVGDKFSPYDVLLIKSDGSQEVYASITTYEGQF